MIRICERLKRPEGKRWVPFFGKLRNNILSKTENWYIKRMKLPANPLNSEPRKQKVIVSLTSFPARIHTVKYAIMCLMKQDYKPDRIILWLAEEQFIKKELPVELVQLKELGLEIRFCDDLKSHKKYFYAMKEQNEDLLLTFDDDLIYGPTVIRELVDCYKKFPHCVSCIRGQTIPIDTDGQVSPVSAWKTYTDEGVKKPSHRLMASTGAGCLYPPHILGNTVFDWDVISECALSADDIWMKAMELQYDVKVVKTSKRQKVLTTICDSQTERLNQLNDFEGQNDIVLIKLIDRFPEAFSRLSENS